MADSGFRTELVKDATIADITSDLTFAVESGASSTTYQQIQANTASNNSMSFQVQVPSESIVFGRDVLIRTGLTFRANVGSASGVGGVPVGLPALTYGYDAALAPFPFASLITTANCQINNTNVSINLQDVFPQILQLNSRDELAYYNGMCPSLPDGDYGLYGDGVGANNNPLAGYTNTAYDNRLMGRGSHRVKISVVHSVRLIANGAVVSTDTSSISTSIYDTWVYTISTVVSEPLFLSPFTWGNPIRQAMGMCGVNNMSFTFNIDSTLKRLFSSSSSYAIALEAGSATDSALFKNGSYTPSVNGPELLFKYLSTQPSDLIESKNVIPYTDLPRYITTANNASPIAVRVATAITAQNIQLNQIPSKIIIVVRKQMASQTCKDASTFLAINSINVNLNNASGLLSSATAQDLWRMSQRNGSNQTWSQFSGTATSVLQDLPTGGSMIVLNPAYDLSLPDYLTNGSLGNFNLAISLNVTNFYDEAITPEIVIMTVNDGILTTTQGVSSTFTGIISKQMCLDAKAMKAIPSVVDSRMVGGRSMHLNGSLVRKGMDIYNKYKPAVENLVSQVQSGRKKLHALTM